MTHRVGQQLGNYRLLRLLGQGGFADVYLGEHVYLKTQAAVKVLQVHLTPQHLESFLSEARTIASLKHPHIIRVLDFGVEDNTPFLVMDYAPNGTVHRLFSPGTPQSPVTILATIQQVAAALQYAHNNKLIHRDVKPENMLLGNNNELLLSDFGIAVIAQSTRYSAQEVAGTVAYMAPEQIQGKPHPASDQYALGVVIYEWLSGTRPFHGSFAEVATQHLLAPPMPLRQRTPTISPQVEQVVMTALEKDLHKRFADVQTFAHALEEACQFEPRSSSSTSTFIMPGVPTPPTRYFTQPAEAGPTPATMPQSLPAPAQPTQPPVPASRRISRRVLVAGLAGSLIAGGGIIAWVRTQGSSVASYAPSPTPGSKSHPLPTSTSHTRPTASASPTTVIGMRLPFTYRGHVDQVYSVAWSPDGTRIASGGLGDVIQIWNASTGKQLLAYEGHTAKVYSVAWSPDNQLIASGHYDATVRVWNASTGNTLFVYRGHPGSYQGGPNWINAVAWSPNGTRIASASHDTTVQVCDSSGNQLLTYQGHAMFVNTVAWSPDGTRIASGGGDTTVQIWDAANGNTLLTYRGHSDVVVDLSWSPDGKYIASGGVDKTVQVWDAFSGKHLLTYQGHTQVVNAVGWSPNGSSIASGGNDTTVQIWNALSGTSLLTYRGHLDVVQALAWSPDSTRVASASNDRTVQICSAI